METSTVDRLGPFIIFGFLVSVHLLKKSIYISGLDMGLNIGYLDAISHLEQKYGTSMMSPEEVKQNLNKTKKEIIDVFYLKINNIEI